MDNFILSVSNISFVTPLYSSIRHNDLYTSLLLSLLIITSAFSHLIENHKHKMIGFGFSTKSSYYANRADVFFSIACLYRMCSMYITKYGFDFTPLIINYTIVIYALCSLIILKISEYNNTTYKTYYVPMHCMWHLCISYVMHMYLTTLIY